MSPEEEEVEGNGNSGRPIRKPSLKWASFLKTWSPFLLALCLALSNVSACFCSTSLVPSVLLLFQASLISSPGLWVPWSSQPSWGWWWHSA